MTKIGKEIQCWIFLALWQLTWIIPAGINAMDEQESVTEVIETETVKESEPEVELVIKEPVEASPENQTEDFESISFITEEIQKLSFEIAYEYQIAAEPLIVIIAQASSGDVYAVNKDTGCVGLM